MMRYIESRIGGVQKIRCLVGGQVVRLTENAERVTFDVGDKKASNSLQKV